MLKMLHRPLSFNERAFGLSRRFLHESGSYAEMETGATALAFAHETFIRESFEFANNRLERDPAGFEVGLVCDDVDAAFDRAIRMGTAVIKPTIKPWGHVVSYVRDLNGVLVEICSPVSAE